MPPARLRYQTVEIGPYDIHVRSLWDRLQYDDDDGIAESFGVPPAMWSLFGIVWDSSKVLAERMVDMPVGGRRVLEVGCGIGLASLVLSRRQANVTATDQHPSAADFLAHNLTLNEGGPVPFVRAGWSDEEVDLGRFDLIIGSDLLYEAEQVDMLASFIHDHAAPTVEVVLVDPGRGHLGRFAHALQALGIEETRREAVVQEGYRGQVLVAERSAPVS